MQAADIAEDIQIHPHKNKKPETVSLVSFVICRKLRKIRMRVRALPAIMRNGKLRKTISLMSRRNDDCSMFRVWRRALPA